MKNLTTLLLCISAFCSFELTAQTKNLLVLDLTSGQIDTLPQVLFDTSTLSDKTNYFVGQFDNNINRLPESTPSNFLRPNTQFTTRKPATDSFNILDFPIRTTVLQGIGDPATPALNCSGNLVSKRHILLALDCILDRRNLTDYKDSIYVCPIFNKGEINSNFGCSKVEKIYFFEGDSRSTDNIALLELGDPIGEEIGWISIGFEKQDDILLQSVFHKLSYTDEFPQLDSYPYNGDTLYHSYGNITEINPQILRVKNALGLPGELGSSLIHIENNEAYTSYGVAYFATRYTHLRITQEIFYNLKSVLEPELTVSTAPSIESFDIQIFPNPVSELLNFRVNNSPSPFKANLINHIGVRVWQKEDMRSGDQIDMSNYPDGVYFLQFILGDQIRTEKIIKIRE